MLEQLKRIFTKQEETSDGLEQIQREAIIDLLLLCRYADNHLALMEDSIFDEEVESFHWDSGTHLEGYIQEATSRVRNIRSSTDARGSFLESVSERLQEGEVKDRALDLCKRLFRSDGVQSEEEDVFEKEIRDAFERMG